MLLKEKSDLAWGCALPRLRCAPGRAESTVALHLIDRRVHPPRRRGQNELFERFFDSFTRSQTAATICLDNLLQAPFGPCAVIPFQSVHDV